MSENRGDGMQCPQCGGARCTRVTGHGAQVQPGTVRRRRACKRCGGRFMTEEAVIDVDHEAARLQAITIMRRYILLGSAGRAAVRAVMDAVEEAAMQGARHEAEALTAETLNGGPQVQSGASA